jgi:opacity protein-like surface antigen
LFSRPSRIPQLSPGPIRSSPAVILPFDDGKAPWFASIYGDVGGGPNSDLTWQFFGGLGYDFNKTIAGFAGYRYLEIQHSTGNYSFRINQQGPMVGVAFRF